ncbi:DUF1315 family protein [Marinomonas hwangdonensis]|uniref:DUF1315 family protein n=1 Tax=Marinomonas hwangdonensis TaxID=1053647 RepID=A0A3M8Q548_9GAMM|nr:DUF1315 family protein [Marinomonas hwangdonensis]MDP5055431.1 YeaC family protein [Marinomonas hwangdonensis]RNF50040.1 DUF1315 family protein [Marinomonas hwangdonensis]
MNFKEMIDNMSPEVYVRLKQAVELGKWPNGVRLTPDQTEICLQAIITYDHSKKAEKDRVGYINTEGHKGNRTKSADEQNTIKWVGDGPEGQA